MLNEKILKQKIGETEYSFKMTNKTIRNIDEEYGNYATILYGLMEGKQFFSNSLKLISKCCIEKDFSIEELEEIITGQQYRDLTTLAVNLYLDYMGLNNDETENKDTENKEEPEKK